jgi:hypothetical protein
MVADSFVRFVFGPAGWPQRFAPHLILEYDHNPEFARTENKFRQPRPRTALRRCAHGSHVRRRGFHRASLGDETLLREILKSAADELRARLE